MNIGRRIYYELSTGNVIVDTGERTGHVVATTQDQDFEQYAALAERVRSTVGVVELPYGAYAEDFAICTGYRVNTTTGMVEFSYPDPNEPEAPPVYRLPLSDQVSALEAELADTKTQLAIAKDVAAETSATQQQLIEILVDMGVI